MFELLTERLRIRPFTTGDAPFMLGLLNEPSYYQNIGDRGIRTLEQCEKYLQDRFMANYPQGIGMWAIELKATGQVIGFAGLIKRDTLDLIDIGYAFPPPHWGKGYATESCLAIQDYARDKLGLKRLGGIVDPANAPSIRVLEKLGMKFERTIQPDPKDIALSLYARDL